MTTVADLVAKLGFKVDDSGFNKFKNSLQAFQSIVRDGIKDLKEYAKQAEKISKAFQNAYLPSRKDAEARFRADTYAIRAKAYAQRVRAKWLPEQLAIRRLNAETRERQTTLKEAGLNGGGSRSTGASAIVATLGMLTGGIEGVVRGGFATLGAVIAGPIGAAVGNAVGGAIMAVGRFIVNQIRQALSYIMAFRDYRSFTGRSSSGLNNLMGMTKWATNLTPQDILKDATAMGQSYWDMWFGGGNPAVWQLLGLTPTMNGETNLKNILSRIHSVTGGGKNKGLALNLLKQFGLSEDYMNIFEHWQEYKAGGGMDSFMNFSDEQIKRMEEANKSLKEFSQILDQVRVDVVDSLLKSGLKEFLLDLANYLKGLFQAFRSGKIHDFSSFQREFFSFDRMVISGSIGRHMSRSEYNETVGKKLEELKKQYGYYDFSNSLKNIIGKGVSEDFLRNMATEAVLREYAPQQNVTYNNQFNMQGQPLDQSVSAAQNIMSGEASQNQLSAGYTMMSTVPA